MLSSFHILLSTPMEHHSPIDTQNLLDMIKQESRTAGPKISLYFSVPQSSDFAMMGRAELKANIQVVAARLETIHTPDAMRRAILEHLRSLVESNELWERRSESYAIFVSASLLRYYALPLPIRGGLWVNEDFQITPLIHLLSLPEHFYVLAVSLGTPLMVRVHPQFSVPVSLENVWSVEAMVNGEEVIHSRQFHTAGHSNGAHHGNIIPDGASRDGEFRKRERLLVLLTKTVDKLLEQEQASSTMRLPLVLTGTDELVAHCIHHLHYRNILIAPERMLIPVGNPIALDSGLWHICAQLYSDREARDLSEEHRFEELRAHGSIVEDIDEILSLSASGGIKTLFINETALAASDYNRSEMDHVNAALVQTLRHHGNVQESPMLPSRRGIAALPRPGHERAMGVSSA